MDGWKRRLKAALLSRFKFSLREGKTLPTVLNENSEQF
jgi:hypothetical protein